MQAFKWFLISALSFTIAARSSVAQSLAAEKSTQHDISYNMLNKVNDNAKGINQAIERNNLRYLKRLSKIESKLRKQLFLIDSVAAKGIFDQAAPQYNLYSDEIANSSTQPADRLNGQYMAGLDSLQGSLKFVSLHPELMTDGETSFEKLNAAKMNVNQIQSRLVKSDEISAFLKQRKQLIKQTLDGYTNLPKGLAKSYSDFSKETFYYSTQIKEYKQLLDDPQKAEQKLLAILNKQSFFQDFMAKNSLLSGLFSIPSNYAEPAALNGLQTRDQVQQLIGNQLSSAGQNGMNVMQQQMQAAQAGLGKIKDKIAQMGKGSENIDLPDFKPNSNKTRPFLKRLEMGTNFQTSRSNNFFPTTTDIGFSAGYKLTDRNTIGLGLGYKLGLGKDIRHINLSHQGIGLRSFIDYKIKGSFWLAGGAEMNRRSQFNSFQTLKERQQWQKSVLIGLSKKYQINKKRKGNAQVLYDALWKQQIPKGQPIIFRTGFSLK